MTSADLTIFCIDDDYAYQRYIDHSVGPRYNVEHISSGEECLARTQTGLVDLILIVTPLKNMSANEVCEFIKEDPSLKQVPVIFLTESDSKLDRDRAFESGADDYL
ncbi:MAG: response regulator [Pseudomonadales bacterium]|nr:response regulator [Pseudomonadales bacterium]